MITSCVARYIDPSIVYRDYISTQWKIVVSRDVKFDEDLIFSSCQYFSLLIKEAFALEVDSKVRDESNLWENKVILGINILSPTTLACKKMRWLTQIIQESWEHLTMPKSSMRFSIPSRRYFFMFH